MKPGNEATGLTIRVEEVHRCIVLNQLGAFQHLQPFFGVCILSLYFFVFVFFSLYFFVFVFLCICISFSLYDKVSANVTISVQKMGESGQMVF